MESTKELERICLSSLMKYPKKIGDIMSFVKPDFFQEKENATVYSCILSLYNEKGLVDQVLITSKLQALGITHFNRIDTYEYITNVLMKMPVNEEFIENYFRELIKFHQLRKCLDKLKTSIQYINGNSGKSMSEIYPEIEKQFTDALTVSVEDDIEFRDIYGEQEQELRARAESEIAAALETSFKIFDRKYGGLSFGDLFVFAAPAKKGKSTFLNCLSDGVMRNPINNCKVLVLDTELEGWRVMTRNAAARTGINEWFFKTGKFKTNEAMVDKANKIWKENQAYKGKVTHVYVANRQIDDVISIARRWHAKYVKKGESALIIYDYMKLCADKVSEFWKEYQVIGEKTDKLKKLASALPHTVICTSIQTNAGGDIGQSQQVKWFGSNVYILEPKSLEEISQHGVEFGTHKLIEIAARNQGQDAHGMYDVVKFVDENGKISYKQNYINFDFQNFNVTEKGTFADVASVVAKQLEVEKDIVESKF